MIKKLLIFVLLLMPIALGDLSEFPEPFVVDHYTDGFAVVTGSKYVGLHSNVATEIIFGIRPVKGNFLNRLDTEILNDYKNYHLLLIGNPCQNLITKEVLGSSDCSLGLGPGEAIIKLVDNGNKKAIIVAGYDFDSLRQAGLVLAHYNTKDLKGEEYKIVIEPISGENINNEISDETKFAGKCDGCIVAQSCLNEGEIVLGEYCDGKNMNIIKLKGESCEKDYECLDKKCINNLCSRGSLWQRFFNWLKILF